MNVFTLLAISREIREVVLLVAQLLRDGKELEAEEVLRNRRLGKAAGRAAYEASRRAGLQ